MEKRIAIFGAGGMGREILQLIRDINESQPQPIWSCVGFIVDKGFESATIVSDLPILGDITWLVANPDVYVVVGIGSSAARWRIANQIKSQCKNSFATLVHPRAWVGQNVEIGAGSIICAGALITIDIKILEHVHVGVGSTIGHDAVFNNFVTLNPGVNISGNILLKEGVEIGAGSIIIPKCTVGDWSIIGAGAVVTKSLAANCTAVGVPARIIKERSSGWQRD